MRWDYVYEEEHFDINGYCSVGIFSNGIRYLFFTVSSPAIGEPEECSVYSSMSFAEECLLCKYDWSAENDEVLFCALNSLSDNCNNLEISRVISDVIFRKRGNE